MIFVNPIIDDDTCIDLYAGNSRSYKELLPLWDALAGRQGIFFVSQLVHDVDFSDKHFQKINGMMQGCNPIVVNSYKDLNDIFVIGNERPFIMYEVEDNTETRGLLNIVSAFIVKSEKMLKMRRVHSENVYLYNTVQTAAKKIFEYCKGKDVKHVTEINGKSVGIMYMTWGEKALQAAKKSLATLKRTGYSYPAAFVGPFFQDEQWENGKGCNIACATDPFDVKKARGFQFRAGRVKPQLCHLSPFDYTLYIDADTNFIQPIQPAFELLADYDLLVTDEKLTLLQLYNKQLAGWELNIVERNITIEELDNQGGQNFVNSGVIFFRKNNKTLRLFADWYNEWKRFQEWDEQLALMRAMHKNKSLKIKHLPVVWNSPHLTNEAIIFHNYGRGVVRSTL